MPGLARKNKKSLDARSGEGAERCGLEFLSVTEAGTLEGPQPQ